MNPEERVLRGKPVTWLTMGIATVFALLMLFLPFQFQSLALMHLYPHLRLFGLAYGVSAVLLGLAEARVGLPRWVGVSGTLLYVTALGTQAYLVAFLPGVLNGQVLYALLVAAALVTLALPNREPVIMAGLYGLACLAIGVLMVARPGAFYPAGLGPAPAGLGPLFVAAGVMHGLASILPRRFRLPAWVPPMAAVIPFLWFALQWGTVGNWIGSSVYTTIGFMSALWAADLASPAALPVSQLRRRIAAAEILVVVLPLAVMGTFSVYVAESLEQRETDQLLTVAVLQAQRAVERAIIRSAPVFPDSEGLTAEARKAVEPMPVRVEVRPLPVTVPGESGSGLIVLQADFDQDLQRYLTATLARPELGLVISASEPAVQAYHQANRLAVVALLITVLMGALAVVGTRVFSNRLLLPLTEIRQVALAIGRRHFGARTQPSPAESGELADVSEAINNMAATLEVYHNQMERLQWITDTALAHLSMSELVSQLLLRIRQVLNADAATILLLTNERTELAPAGSIGLEGEIDPNDRIPLGQGFAGRVAAERRVLVVDDVSAYPVITRHLRERVRSVVGAPLIVHGEVMGVVHVGTFSRRSFSQDDARLLQMAADRIALAMENARIFAAEVEDRRQIEEKAEIIERLNSSLEQRVAERTAELVASNRELEAFAYSVSHDLRAPLRSIHGFSQALAEDCAPCLDSAGTEYLRRIQAAAGRMGQLIDALLLLSRVVRADLDRQPVDLSLLVRSVLAELGWRHPDRLVAADVQDGVLVCGDPALLRIAVENLVENAWKFTAGRSPATIEFRVTQQGGERVCSLRDNGIGFDMAYVGKLFRPFERLSTDERFSGSGIGLATVQRIIERHGGRIWAESVPDRGAAFSFTLPCE
jgi:signal transduction histidine kinase